MIKTITLVLFVLTLYCIAQPNAPSSPSASCSTDISGPNLASPAKRQSVVCSGNGQCNGDTCVCNAGYQGNDCETACTVATTAPSTAEPTDAPTVPPTLAPSTAAPSSDAPSTAAPSTAAPTTAAPSTAAPSAAPSTAAPSTDAPSTAAPTTQPVQNTATPTYNCYTCPAGFVHWYDVSGMSQPDDACACVVPSSTTPAPTSATCANVDISGPNNASPARRFWNKIRQSSVCNGNGYCSGQSCVCNSGYSGSDCEVSVSSGTPTPAATENTSGENNAKAADSSATKVTSGALIITAVAILLL